MKLLVTAAGTGTGYGYCLARARYFPEIGLITADTNPRGMLASSLFADAHVQVPPFDPETYSSELAQLVAGMGITHCLPLLDPEIRFLAENRARFAMQLLINSEAFCRFATSKSHYLNLLGELGIASPRQLDEYETRQVERWVEKKDMGFGGRETVIVDSRYSRPRRRPGWTCYEYIDGLEYTVDCFPLDVQGQVFTSVRQRVETKAGVCTKARLLEDDDLDEYARILVRYFGLSHPFTFQTRKAGRHYLIDLNPRLGAGTAMSTLNGADFFAAHLAQLCGKDPSAHLVRRFRTCTVVRQYAEFLTETT